MRLSLPAQAFRLGMKYIEKPAIARAKDPAKMRARFERSARLLFRPPAGTRRGWTRIAGHDVLKLTPPVTEPGRHIVYVHGGGFIFGSPNTHAALAAQIAKRCRAVTYLPRYPLAPEHHWPTGSNALFEVWTEMTAQLDAPPILGGDSAGGAMVLELLARLTTEKAQQPQACFAFSPLTDLTFSAPSLTENADSEWILPAQRAQELAEMFLGPHSAADYPHPLHATFSTDCPIWLSVADTEILRDDVLGLGAALGQQGVNVTLHRKGDLPHVWPIFHNYMPEARETLRELTRWIKSQWPPAGDS